MGSRASIEQCRWTFFDVTDAWRRRYILSIAKADRVPDWGEQNLATESAHPDRPEQNPA
jgi:hypothetical protein